MKLSRLSVHWFRLVTTIGFALAVLPARLVAEDVGWHTDLTLELGRGYSHRNPRDVRKIVAVFNLNPAPDLIDQTGKKWDVTYTQHQFDVSRLLDLNASVSARNLTVNGKVGVTFVDSTQFSENSVTFAVVFNNDFGRRVYHPTGVSQEFQAFVTAARQTLRGAALHKAITDEFGTHFITGHKSEAKLLVLYRFDFGTSSKAREITAGISGSYASGVNSANWQAKFQDLLTQRDSSITLSYRLTTSATTTNGLPSLPPQGTIASVAQFQEFVNKLQAYGEAMKEQHATQTRYIIEPIQNLPGYAALVDSFSPSARFDNSYERFMETYAEFKAWDDTLFRWSSDPQRMSWLNADGQKIVRAMRADVSLHLDQLQATARKHFESGTPLELNEDILNYRANFNKIPIPRIRQSRLAEFKPCETCHWVLWIGGIEAGPPDLTIDKPFSKIALLVDGTEGGTSFDVFHNEADFIAYGKQGAGFKGNTDVAGLFNDFLASPAWQALRADAAQTRIGFVACFFANSDPFDFGRLSLAVKDAAGQFVASVPWLATASAGSFVSAEGSRQTGLALSVKAPPSPSTSGIASIYHLSVANNGPGSAYGVVTEISIPASFKFSSTSGTQGSGEYSGGKIAYQVGSLAGGATATIHLELIPLTLGKALSAGSAEVRVGDGLVDPDAADNRISLPPVDVAERAVLETARVLQIGKASSGPGAAVAVPITLNADGTENALSFSLSFAPSQATFGNIAPGSGLSGASLVVNNNQAASGQIGVVISLPVNQTIPRGSQLVATLTLNLVPGLSAGTVIPIQFANSPAPKSASDSLGGDLPVNYLDGSITVVTGYEGDVAPRSNGNNLVNAADVTVMGRIVAGLESNLSAAEFQRADCAPRSSFGNGAINAGDLTQVARYVAGFDPQTSAGGPTAPSIGPANASGRRGTLARKSAAGTRRASVVNATVAPGGTVTAVVQMNAQGDENALSYSLAFDATKLNLVNAALGTGATGASLVVNSDQATSGKVGVVISLPVNQNLQKGNIELLKLTFQAGSVSGNAVVAFSNAPAPQSVSDALGNDLTCQFVEGVITIGGGSQAAPVITTQPASVSVGFGGNATFSISATGAATYQWQLNGKDVPGANGPTLTLNNISAERAGLYTVVLGNSSGSVTSAPAVLSLLSIDVYPGLTIIGPVGTRYRIDYALEADAASWMVLTNLTLPVSPYLFYDGAAPVRTKRFYRAVSQP